MASIRIDIEGTDELERKLKTLSKAAATSIAKDAVDEGAAVIQFNAQLNALNVFSDRQRGQLRNSIRSESRIVGNGAEAEIGPNVEAEIGPPVIYGRIQELGGTIRPVHGQYLKFQIDGEWRQVKQVTIPARPYLRPAAEEHIDQISEVMREAIADGIDNAV